MRFLLVLFAFAALALAPLGMAAEARSMDDHCSEMAGENHGDQRQDAPDAQPVESCCTVSSAALPAAGAVVPHAVFHAPSEAKALALLIGVRREVEVPPPRA